jgi:GT2 family glycosyltransferase
MKISIIIVSFNVKEFVKRCIESIQKYAGSYDYEIIVIDNNSEDNTTGFLKDSFPDIKLIENDRNIGFGAANNIAAEIATGEILIFANPDTELTSSIDKLVMLSSKKNIGAVFGKLKYPDGEVQEFIRKFSTLLNQLVEVFGIPLISERFGGTGEMMRRGHYIYEKEGEIEAASGAFFLMKKKYLI